MTTEYPEQTSKLPGDDTASTDPYKCWFAYLKETDRSEWSEDVAENFGEIKNITFEQWWPDHKHLFTKIVPMVIEEIVTQQELEDLEGYVEDPDMAILKVHTYLSQKDIKAAFEEWLKKKNLKKRGTPKPSEDFSLTYGLDWKRKTDTYMLNNALKAYVAVQKEKQKPRDKQRRYPEISDVFVLMGKKKNVSRQTKTETVSRYCRIAQQVLDGVKYGEFPVYDDDSAED